jgi:hypothetical protein
MSVTSSAVWAESTDWNRVGPVVLATVAVGSAHIELRDARHEDRRVTSTASEER